ncbi:MAG: energy transducer TonB [bacterium]
MNFSKKNHQIVGQNDKTVRQSQKHEVNVQKNTTLYFQVGLALTLLVVYGLFEMRFEVAQFTLEGEELPPEDVFVMKDVNYIIEENQPKETKPKAKKVILTKEPKIVDDNHPDKIGEDEPVLVTEPVPLGDAPKVEDIKVIPEDDHEPLSIIGVEQVPIYPGCEKYTTNSERRNCMSEKINRLVGRKFNADRLASVGITGLQKVFVEFTIDKDGEVTNIKTFTRNKKFESHLNREAIRVTEKIPSMKPGMQSGKIVPVRFNLPITVNIKD